MGKVYDDRIRLDLTYAENGDVEEQLKAGKAFRYGIYCPVDIEQSHEWYRKAAENGNAYAQYIIADDYKKGSVDSIVDFSEANKWFFTSANQGNVNAMFEIAQAYHYGEGIEKDYSKANEWYQKAADKGHKRACFFLAQNLYNGKGLLKPDVEKAIGLYRQSIDCNLKDLDEEMKKFGYINPKVKENRWCSWQTSIAMYRVGLHLLNTMEKNNQEKEEVFKWFYRAYYLGHTSAGQLIGRTFKEKRHVGNLCAFYTYKAQTEDINAMFEVGRLCEYGIDCDRDYNRANYWLYKAAEKGHKGAQVLLAENLRKGLGVENPDYENAFVWYSRAAEQDVRWAQYGLARAYYNGEGVQQNYEKAMLWYEKSDVAESYYRIAEMWENGQGVQYADEERAYEYYKKAAERTDNVNAMIWCLRNANNRLESIYWYKKITGWESWGYVAILIKNPKFNIKTVKARDYMRYYNQYNGSIDKTGVEELKDIPNGCFPEQMVYRELLVTAKIAEFLPEPDLEIDSYIQKLRETFIEQIWGLFINANIGIECDKVKRYSTEDKLEVLINCDFTDYCNREEYILLKKLKGATKNYNSYKEIMSDVNRLVIQHIYSPGLGGALALNEGKTNVKFIDCRYVWMIYRMLRNEKDIVALYARQILNNILLETFRKKSDEPYWLNSEADIDMEKEIQALKNRGFISKDMEIHCQNLRVITNKAHHITTAKEWNEFNVNQVILETIEVINCFNKEILEQSAKKDLKNTIYYLNFFNNSHFCLEFETNNELSAYTYKKLGEANAKGAHTDAAMYGRRILEMWLDEMKEVHLKSVKWPEDSNTILEKIQFLYQNQLFSVEKKDAAHRIRKYTNEALHIEKQDDKPYASKYIYDAVKMSIPA